MKYCEKRNGKVVNFNAEKIVNAILKAMNASGYYYEDLAKKVALEIENSIFDEETIKISEIESLIYKNLIALGQIQTARAYEGYRSVQAFKRKENTTDSAIWSLLNLSDEDLKNENSNKNSTLNSTQRDLIAGEVSKDLARRKLIPPHIIQAHDEGVIHWHDMDYTLQPMINCCLINLEDMLDNSTVINEKLVESPKNFQTACTITTQIFAQVASNQFGLWLPK